MSGGHIRRRGTTWSYWLDLGLQPAWRCDSEQCGKVVTRGGRTVRIRPVYWVEVGERLTACPKCGGELRETEERRQRTEGGFPTRKAAQDAYTAERGRILRGGDPWPKDMTSRTYSNRWLEHQKVRVRPTTWIRYEQLLRDHVLPRIGSVPLAKLRPADVQQVVDAVLASGRAPRTVLHVYRVLSTALRQAVRWQLMVVNPAAAVQPPHPDRPRLTVPSGQELRRLVEAARGTAWEVPILLAAATGARRSEVLALKWETVDLQAGKIRIVQGLQRVHDGDGRTRLEFFDVKRQRSRREIGLPAF